MKHEFKYLSFFLAFLFCTFNLSSQEISFRDTVFQDIYIMPKDLEPNDLFDDIKYFLEKRQYRIMEDSPLETNNRPETFEKNNAGFFARLLFGRKDLKEYPITIKHTLTFNQKNNGRHYVAIYSQAELEQKKLNEELTEDLQKAARDAAKKIAKDEFDSLKDMVKDIKRSNRSNDDK